MDGILGAIEGNWGMLVTSGLLLSLAGTVVPGIVRAVWITVRHRQDLSPLQRLEPDIGKPDIMKSFQAALVEDRRKSFWPNLWLGLFTNFVTNLIFFILGVIVTLYLSQPH